MRISNYPTDTLTGEELILATDVNTSTKEYKTVNFSVDTLKTFLSSDNEFTNITLGGSIIFEGATANNFETTLSVTDPTADRTVTIPDVTGFVALYSVDPAGVTITSTPAELNKLDGFTGIVDDLNYAKDLRATGVTATEYDTLDGITATTAELNILDGATVTTAEINLLDGDASVGSSITIGDTDGIIINDGGTMKTIPASDIKTYANAIPHIKSGDVTGFTNSIIVGHSTTGTLDNAQNNTAVGFAALNAITSGDSNVAIGYDTAGALTNGEKNVAIGQGALRGTSSSKENVAIGYNALYSQNNTNGAQSYTVAIGVEAGYFITSDQPFCTLIGAKAGDAITTGQHNTIIGALADVANNYDSGSIVIGSTAVGHGSNIVVIGNADITAWHPGDDNGVDLGSASYSFKDSYVQGRSNAGNFKVDALNAAPSSASDTGTVGEIRYTADYIYICVATDTWKRAAIDTWA